MLTRRIVTAHIVFVIISVRKRSRGEMRDGMQAGTMHGMKRLIRSDLLLCLTWKETHETAVVGLSLSRWEHINIVKRDSRFVTGVQWLAL